MFCNNPAELILEVNIFCVCCFILPRMCTANGARMDGNKVAALRSHTTNLFAQDLNL